MGQISMQIMPLNESVFDANQQVGSREHINNIERWCLWLGDCKPDELRKMPACLERVERVRQYRLKSISASTRKIADTPTRFHVENMPESKYLLIPEVSSEKRRYILIGFMSPDILASNLVKISSEATRYHFGVLSSAMHMTWMRYTAGRLKSDYRYSVGIVYNNYPWPTDAADEQIKLVEKAAQEVLNARALYPKSTCRLI